MTCKFYYFISIMVFIVRLNNPRLNSISLHADFSQKEMPFRSYFQDSFQGVATIPNQESFCSFYLKFFQHPGSNSFTNVTIASLLVTISPAFSNDGSNSSWMINSVIHHLRYLYRIQAQGPNQCNKWNINRGSRDFSNNRTIGSHY